MEPLEFFQTLAMGVVFGDLTVRFATMVKDKLKPRVDAARHLKRWREEHEDYGRLQHRE